jgi:hypothetical protein
MINTNDTTTYTIPTGTTWSPAIAYNKQTNSLIFSNNYRIFSFSLTNNQITQIAGTGTAGTDNGNTNPLLNTLYDIQLIQNDFQGNLYVCDRNASLNDTNAQLRAIYTNHYYLVNYCTTN